MKAEQEQAFGESADTLLRSVRQRRADLFGRVLDAEEVAGYLAFRGNNYNAAGMRKLRARGVVEVAVTRGICQGANRLGIAWPISVLSSKHSSVQVGLSSSDAWYATAAAISCGAFEAASSPTSSAMLDQTVSSAGLRPDDLYDAAMR